MPRTIFENIVIQNYEKAPSFEYCMYTSIRFFEILFIEKGEGAMLINGHRIPYQGKQVFVLIPDDKYTFDVSLPTTLTTIKFLKSLFINYHEQSDQDQLRDWFKKIEMIFYSTERTSEVQFRSEEEKGILHALFDAIYKEYSSPELKDAFIIKSTLNSILQLISRNVYSGGVKAAASRIQEILNYIHLHIYDAPKISSRALSARFNIAENYFSQYFKRQSGISLKKYILNHKIKLVETRLRYTDMTHAEIALELGFTDGSHLDKTFNSYKGIAPGAYRMKYRSA